MLPSKKVAASLLLAVFFTAMALLTVGSTYSCMTQVAVPALTDTLEADTCTAPACYPDPRPPRPEAR